MFEKGYDPKRNYAGRPKTGASFAEAIRNLAHGTIPKELKNLAGNHKTLLDAVTAKLYEAALNGDLNAIKLIYERTEGRPSQKVETAITGEVTQITREVIIPSALNDSSTIPEETK